MPVENHLGPLNNPHILKPEPLDRILSLSLLVEETSQQCFSQLRMPKDDPQSIDTGHVAHCKTDKADRSWIY